MKNSFIILLVIVAIAVGIFSFIKLAKPAQNSVAEAKTDEQILDNYLAENKFSDKVNRAFRFALKNPDNILTYAPCYCGCADDENKHANSRDCFINAENLNKNSNDLFDPMGPNCGLCIQTVLLAQEMYEQGKTGDEIKSAIDAKWGPNT